jgi:hypothetical protein
MAGDVILLPLRWCAIDNTPAVTNPMGAPANPYNGTPEPDTDSVLWRRHERASDNIWIPRAEITFRSGVTAAIRDMASFPIVPDPCPPTTSTLCQGGSTAGFSCTPDGSGGSPDCDAGISCATQACPAACTFGCPGNLGDVLDPGPYCLSGTSRGADCTPNSSGQDPAVCGTGVACGSDLSEYNLTVAACTNAWDALADQFSTTLLGEIAVNIGVWRNPAGTRTGLKGRAQRSTVNGNPCAIPPSGVTTATDGAILALDNQNFVASDLPFETTNERMVGHELGHTLELWHGDGLDNDSDGAYDQVCDSSENTCATPTTFMSSTGCGGLTTAATTNQRNTSRAVAAVYTGATMDPPGAFAQGPNVGDQRGDTLVDVTDPAVDIQRVSIQDNSAAARTSFTHVLFGVVPMVFDPDRQYLVFADLDANPATGGDPSTLGFNTAFHGAEIVTRVLVSFSGGEIPVLTTTPTLWRFQSGTFVECTPASDPACSSIQGRILDILGGDDSNSPGPDRPPTPDAHAIQIEFPNSVRGPMGSAVRIQAIAEQLSATIPPANLQLDRLPDGPLDGSRTLRPVAPVYPKCLVTPITAAPGSIAKVSAEGLIEDTMTKVFLGDRRVAITFTDGAGVAETEFRVPVNTVPGLRLVTVGNVGTALTADCFVEVLPGPPIILEPEDAVNPEGTLHIVTATVRDEAGAPIPGVTVTFAVTSGPNAGTTGTCSPSTTCVTGATGQVSFTYLGDGGPGVDNVVASFVSGTTTNTSNVALKFWDADCNLNHIADTCDLSCGGFGGRCDEVPNCGLSLDTNGDGVPDECNLPPDCSDAVASRGILWPPNHKLRGVSVQGVTDPDGDPIAIEVTSIFQDEPTRVAGSGNTCPDGSGIGGPTAHLRAERSGSGDGRVYHVGFTADDGQGGTCTGEITVCVPHDQGGGAGADASHGHGQGNGNGHGNGNGNGNGGNGNGNGKGNNKGGGNGHGKGNGKGPHHGGTCVDQGPIYDSTACP